MLVNTGIRGWTNEEALEPANGIGLAGGVAWRAVDESAEYAVAREAEVLAVTDELKFLDTIPAVEAVSLAGIVAKLEMIAGADRDIGDPTDFPWPHIASVLRDLKTIAGELPPCRCDRAATRADVAKHLEAAAMLVSALKGEEALERRGRLA